MAEDQGQLGGSENVATDALGRRAINQWYLAGPMSGIHLQNYPAFTHACQTLRSQGLKIISPHETVFHPTQPDQRRWQDLLKQDARSLLECEGIILLPGWAQSQGARFELHIALMLGMEVRFYKNGLLYKFD